MQRRHVRSLMQQHSTGESHWRGGCLRQFATSRFKFKLKASSDLRVAATAAAPCTLGGPRWSCSAAAFGLGPRWIALCLPAPFQNSCWTLLPGRPQLPDPLSERISGRHGVRGLAAARLDFGILGLCTSGQQHAAQQLADGEMVARLTGQCNCQLHRASMRAAETRRSGTTAVLAVVH